MSTKSFCRFGCICLILIWAFLVSPAFCLEPNIHKSDTYKAGQSRKVLSYPGFFETDEDQANDIRTWIRSTNLDEFLLKRTLISTELLNRDSDPSNSPSTRFGNTAGTSIKQPMVTNPAAPNNVAYMFDNLRSPILAPYKYKTNNNSLISIVIPFDATDHLMVAPIISYVFSLNGSDRYDLNYKPNVISDLKDNSIFYGGINIIYKF